MAAALPSPPSSVVFDSRYHHHHSSQYSMESATMLSSAHRILDQPPPPTLREILNAYKMKGDGDRDLLLAMLNAKTAEDQRLAETASLHKRVLDSYQQSMYLEPPSARQQPQQQWASPALFSAPGSSSSHASSYPSTSMLHAEPPVPSTRGSYRKRYRSRSPLPPSPTDSQSASAEHALPARSPRSRPHAAHPYALAPTQAYAESYSRSRSPSNASIYSRHSPRDTSPPVRRDSR